MKYYELAIKRKSTRDFKDKKVDAQTLNQIKDYAGQCKRLLPGLPAEWKVLEGNPGNLSGTAGYSGFMIEAPSYLLLLSGQEDGALENAGYMGEDMVLKLTELDLDSCWITITDPALLKQRLHLDTELEPLALIAFGYGKPEGGTRLDIKSPASVHMKQRNGQIAPKLYLEDAVFGGAWGQKSDLADWEPDSDLYRAFIAACCSPSVLNRQPYRFILDHDVVSLVLLEDEMTSPEHAKLNAGIVMLHFAEVLSQNTGHPGRWQLGTPEKSYELPEGAAFAGWFRI